MNNNPIDQLTELGPSAKLVFKTLEYADSGLTQQGIVEQSRLHPRTVRYALTQLETIDVIDDELYIPDARQRLYTLHQPTQ